MRISDWSSDVCSSDLGWLFDSAHRALRSVAERYRAADRRDDPRDGARDPPGSLPVVPGAGRPAAAAVLGFDDRRGPQLPVFRPVGGDRARCRLIPARPFYQSCRRWYPGRGSAGGQEVSALLTVEDLQVDIPVGAGTWNAVRGISFEVSRGETLCIVGESGSGKSLTSLALMDLLPRKSVRSARTLAFKGEDLLKIAPRRMEDLRGSHMSMIFQEPMTSLNPALTIGTQLMETVLRHKRVSKTAARERAVYLLDKVGIPSAETRLDRKSTRLNSSH